jgi:hypothetical protein
MNNTAVILTAVFRRRRRTKASAGMDFAPTFISHRSGTGDRMQMSFVGIWVCDFLPQALQPSESLVFVVKRYRNFVSYFEFPVDAPGAYWPGGQGGLAAAWLLGTNASRLVPISAETDGGGLHD